MGKKHQEQRSISVGDTCLTPLLLALQSASFPKFVPHSWILHGQKSHFYHHLQLPELISITATLSLLAEVP